MPAPKETYRESHRRSHRLLGIFLALRAWHMGVDCVAVQRKSLLQFLELQNMQNQRVDWIRNDIRDLFPYVRNTVSSEDDVYATTYFSRLPFPEAAFKGSMHDNKRCKKLRELGLSVDIVKIPDEKQLVVRVALVSHGLISAGSISAE